MLSVIRSGQVTPAEIENLREVVGWDRCEGTYAEILRRHWAYYTVRDDDGCLVGYLSVLSDGIADAFLLDLMVHPAYRHRGIGTSLVAQVVADVRAAGIRCLQVTYSEELRPFYERCGFTIFGGGIIDFQPMPTDSM